VLSHSGIYTRYSAGFTSRWKFLFHSGTFTYSLGSFNIESIVNSALAFGIPVCNCYDGTCCKLLSNCLLYQIICSVNGNVIRA